MMIMMMVPHHGINHEHSLVVIGSYCFTVNYSTQFWWTHPNSPSRFSKSSLHIWSTSGNLPPPSALGPRHQTISGRHTNNVYMMDVTQLRATAPAFAPCTPLSVNWGARLPLQSISRRQPCRVKLANRNKFTYTTHCIANSNGSLSNRSEDNGHTGDEKLDEIDSLSAAQAKDLLLDTIKTLINEQTHVETIQKSIVRLESFNVVPATLDFTELAIAGTWDLKFSSTRLRQSGSIRIRAIHQRFNTEEKLLINEVTWSFPAKNNLDNITATLAVNCSYKLLSASRMEVELKTHTIDVLDRPDGKPNQLPEDMQTIVDDLRKALPVEYFDPSGLSDITYIEPNFRIARFEGKRIAGARNIFTRTT